MIIMTKKRTKTKEEFGQWRIDHNNHDKDNDKDRREDKDKDRCKDKDKNTDKG